MHFVAFFIISVRIGRSLFMGGIGAFCSFLLRVICRRHMCVSSSVALGLFSTVFVFRYVNNRQHSVSEYGIDAFSEEKKKKKKTVVADVVSPSAALMVHFSKLVRSGNKSPAYRSRVFIISVALMCFYLCR